MDTYTIFAGVNGSGKTSVYKSTKLMFMIIRIYLN